MNSRRRGRVLQNGALRWPKTAQSTLQHIRLQHQRGENTMMNCSNRWRAGPLASRAACNKLDIEHSLIVGKETASFAQRGWL